MRPLKISLLLAVGLTVFATARAAEFSSLEERMSEQEFREAGLDKLSADELARLNDWLRARMTAPQTAQADRTGFKPTGGLLGDNGDARVITSRVKGEFTGWNRGTVLELENGQAWEITDSNSFSVPAMQSPGVTIEPAMLGSWLIKVQGFNRSARATRVR